MGTGAMVLAMAAGAAWVDYRLPVHTSRNDSSVEKANCEVRGRPSLIYKHMSKTAGTLTWNIIDALNGMSPAPVPEFTFARDTESFQTWIKGRRGSFIIASIRDVCSLYRSQWRYSPRDGCMCQPTREEMDRCLAAAASGDFERWIRASAFGTVGQLSCSFWWTYYAAEGCGRAWWNRRQREDWNRCFSQKRITHDLMGLQSGAKTFAHCWVRQEFHRGDLLACLAKYSRCRERARHGGLDLNRVATIIDAVTARFSAGDAKKGMRVADKQPKRGDDHECRARFLESKGGRVAALVRALDPVLWNLTSCCGEKERRGVGQVSTGAVV